MPKEKKIERNIYYTKSNCTKSCIADLAEVVSVTPAAPMPGPPKKTDDKSFFDVSIYSLIEKNVCNLNIQKMYRFFKYIKYKQFRIN